MQQSRDRILTSHVGSLPRPDYLKPLILAKEDGKPVDGAAFDTAVARAVDELVVRQVAIGIDVVSDGEASKASYSTYIKDRLSGFGGPPGKGHAAKDLLEFIDYARWLVSIGGTVRRATGPTCNGPIAAGDGAPLRKDLANFARARAASRPLDAFLTAASPGVAAVFLANAYYPSHSAYLAALAEALRPEYEAIVAAGFVLQLDCPDLAMGRHLMFKALDTEAFRRQAAEHVEVLNAATAGIPPDRLRLHLCWGNYQGPHHHDIALEDILDIVLGSRAQALSIEGANPRHEHEWEVFLKHKLPEDRIVVPGVIDSVSNFIEHPRLVAQRICRYAELVGRERVIAGTDCGFATFAEQPGVHPDIAWAKLSALVEGAAIASERLWRRRGAA
ncbi:MAG: cobalamin-independent methionine synthase II family protein [Alphaproteobacteria bacterium]|nr:cobalamin-independent methionine synthase II family protein [Alphaproteobacteria bacterium]